MKKYKLTPLKCHQNMSDAMLLANNPVSQFELKSVFENTSFLKLESSRLNVDGSNVRILNLFVSPAVAMAFNEANGLICQFRRFNVKAFISSLYETNSKIYVYTDKHLTNFELNPERLRNAFEKSNSSSGFELGNSILYQLSIVADNSGILPTGQFLQLEKVATNIVSDVNQMDYDKLNFDPYLVSNPFLPLFDDARFGFNLNSENSQQVVCLDDISNSIILAESLHELVIFGSYRFGKFFTNQDDIFEPNDLAIWLDYVGPGAGKDDLEMYSLIDSEIYDKTVIGTYKNDPIILVLDRSDASRNGIYLGSIEPEQLLSYTLTEFLKRTLLYL